MTESCAQLDKSLWKTYKVTKPQSRITLSLVYNVPPRPFRQDDKDTMVMQDGLKGCDAECLREVRMAGADAAIERDLAAVDSLSEANR